MTRSGDDSERGESIIDIVDGITQIARENKDLLESFFGDSGRELSLEEPLTEAHVTDDKVKVVAELRGEKPNEMGVRFEGGEMYMSIGDTTLRARVPDDIVEDSVDAQMNNGVLRIEVDRIDDGDMKTVEISEEESIVDGSSDSEDSVEDILSDDESINGGDDDGSDE